MAGVRKQHGRPALAASGEVCAPGSSAARFAADLAVGAPAPKAAPDRRCFVAATMILMADGGVAPIERVVVGATVIGRQGRANRVTSAQPSLWNIVDSVRMITSPDRHL